METSTPIPIEPRRPARILAGVALGLASIWLLTGALFKLFEGNPNMLPPLLLQHSPFSWILTFRLAILIELSIVCLAVSVPRVGWMAISAMFAVFLVILVDQEMRGAKSCGCLGEQVKFPPLLMMSIDGPLLAFVLLTRPWKYASGRDTRLGIAVPFFVAASVAPWVLTGLGSSAPVPAPVKPGGSPATATAQQPSEDPSANSKVWIAMDPGAWVGKSIYDVAEFTQWVPTGSIPSDGRIVLWRQSCEHCAKHLEDMANEKEQAQPILLVQVRDDLSSGRAVQAMPSGANVTQVELPAGAIGLFETPVEIRVEGGVVKQVLHREDFEGPPK